MALTITNLLPSLISRLDRSKPWMNWVTGTVMFSDVSGFTPLSEDLSRLGPEGAEILTDILNRYFSEMISIIGDYGGDVFKFGGDALLSLFPGDGSLLLALAAGLKMQSTMTRFQQLRTPLGSYSLKMKIGIATGEVLIAGLGDPKIGCEYIIAGDPVDQSAEAEHEAEAGDLILYSKSQVPSGEILTFSELKPHIYRIHSLGKSDPLPYRENICGKRSQHRSSTRFFINGGGTIGGRSMPVLAEPEISGERSELGSYIASEIVAMIDQGYDHYIGSLLHVVPAFIHFTGFTYERKNFDLEKFNEFVTTFLRITGNHGGRLNSMSMGDKGSSIYVTFGAPRALENKERISCAWALALVSEIHQKFPEMTLKIGLNSGKVFSGLVGGKNRYAYSVMGDAVNVAARLMQAARTNHILISDSIYDEVKKQFSIAHAGLKKLKGKKRAMHLYELQAEKTDLTTFSFAHDGPFVHRKAELKQISQYIESVDDGTPLLIVLEGEPGIGKTSLAKQIIDEVISNKWKIINFQADQISQNFPYSPWSYSLKRLFFGETEPQRKEILSFLQEHAPKQNKEREYIFKFLCNEGNSNFTLPDNENRLKLFHHHLVSLVLNHHRGKTVLYFDNLHWFDSLSLDLLAALLNELEKQQICIIATSRPNWPRESFINRSSVRFLQLREFDREEVRSQLELKLKGQISKGLISFIYKQSTGNPFYVINLLKYLQENDFLDFRINTFHIKQEAVARGTLSTDEVIIAQVERLTLQQQLHLKYAACIGPLLSLKILKEVLGSLFRKESLAELIEKGFFLRRDETTVSFNQTLLQDVIYRSLPQKMRKNVHRKIGRTIERLFNDKLEKYVPQLGYHFFLAEFRHKAIQYCLQAGESLYQNGSFREALPFLKNAYSLLKYTSDMRKSYIGFFLIRTLNRLNKIDESLSLVNSLRRWASRKKKDVLDLELLVLSCGIKARANDFSFTRTAERKLQKMTKMDTQLCINLNYSLGLAYFRKGLLDRAQISLWRVISAEKDQKSHDLILSARLFLASIAKRKGDYEQALTLTNQSIKIAQKHNNHYHELSFINEKANIYSELQNFNKARKLYTDVIEKSEELGDMYMLATAMLHYGNTSIDLGLISLAKQYLNEAKRLLGQLGAKDGWAHAMNALGTIAFEKGDFEDALQKYSEAVNQLERRGELGEVVIIYYNLTEVCIKLHKINEAKNWLKKYDRCIDELRNPQLQEDSIFLHELINSGCE